MIRTSTIVLLIISCFWACDGESGTTATVHIPEPELEIGKSVGFTITLASTTIARQSRIVDESGLSGNLTIFLTREEKEKTKVVLSFQSFVSTSPRGPEVHNPENLFGAMFPTYDPNTRSVTYYSSNPSLNLAEVMRTIAASGSFNFSGPESLFSTPFQTLSPSTAGNEFQIGQPIRNETFSTELGKITTSVELVAVDLDKAVLRGWASIESPRLQGVDHDIKGITSFKQETSLVDGHPLLWQIETKISGNLMLPGDIEPVQIETTFNTELRRIIEAKGRIE